MTKMVPLRWQGLEEKCKVLGRRVWLLNELLRQVLPGFARYFARKGTASAESIHPRRVTLLGAKNLLMTTLQTRLGVTRRSARARMFPPTQTNTMRTAASTTRVLRVVTTLTATKTMTKTTTKIKAIQILSRLRLIRSNLEIEATTSQEH
jgi:hypothetical protein